MSNIFHWGLPDVDQGKFLALTDLLSLRNGGQLEPDFDEPTDDDSNVSDSDTARPERLSYSGHERLKKKFLDRFAELVSCRKGRTHVCCAAMSEEQNVVRIWVSR